MEGTRLGPYDVQAELGSGGMGKVYRAELSRDAAGLEAGTAVALKVIHTNLLEQEGFFQRFLREADIGRSVQHENVVRTYVADALMLDGAQQNFLVMEYVEGQTLRDLLVELGRVPEELCRHIGREVAKGLAAIHETGVVHRDIKPENVLITERHVVKVMDLGVARLQDEAVRLSQAGVFVGSLEYAAPEQFRSADGEPDGRADLHALGVILYELATGQHPYRDEDVSRILRNILDEHPRKAGEVNPQLSPFFEEVVTTLIAKDPAERFADAPTLVGILEEGEKSTWWQERAKALRIQTRQPLRRIRIPRETALYGRDDELAGLDALYRQATEGQGRVLLLEGEAGIGKTRLVDEFVGRLRQDGEDLNFLFGSYPPGGAATAAGAFSTAYRAQFDPDGSKDYLAPTPLLVPAFDALLRGDATPAGAQPLTKDSLQTVFVHATRALAAERPTIVLIDDLHFAPEDGRGLFASLAMAVPGHRVLLIGTIRPGVAAEWLAEVDRLEQAGRMALSRLGPKDLTNLLKDSFRSERLALELAGQIAIKCDGNPFFAFEIIRGLREGQFISQQADGTWITTRAIEDIQVPSSILDLVNARVADLTQEERDLLDVAACWGFEFDPALICDVTGVARIPLYKQLAQIERAHRLVRSSGRNFVFDHHQVQEALYASLPEVLREEYHAVLAEALEAREQAADKDPQDLDGALCVDLCEHHLKGAQGQRALRYLDAALTHLQQGYLHDQAVTLIDRALAVPDLLTGLRRAAVLLQENARLGLLGRRDAQAAVLEEASALAEAGEDPALRATVADALAVLFVRTGRHEEARAHGEQALAIYREVGDRKGEAVATISLGNVFLGLGRFEEAQAHYERACAICREIGYRRGEAQATTNLGNVFGSLGRLEEARTYFERALAIHRELGNRGDEARTTTSLGNVFKGFGRFEEAQAYYERALATFRELGDRLGEGIALGSLGLMFSSLGRLEEARAHQEQAIAIHREVGHRGEEAITLGNLGTVFRFLGSLEEARAHFEAALAICREIGARYPEGYWLLGLAQVADEAGEPEEARRLARASHDLRRELRHADGMADSLCFLGDLEGRTGGVEEARALLEESLALSHETGEKAEVATVLALLAALPGGDATAAEQALAEAGEAGNRSEVRYHLFEATGKPGHLAEAKRLLDDRVEHAPEAYRESMIENVRLHREIMKAWKKHGATEP